MYDLPGCIWPSLVVVLSVSAPVPACIRLAPETGLPPDS